MSDKKYSCQTNFIFYQTNAQSTEFLTHWGWVTHICICKFTIIASDNGLSPGRRQAIIWTNAGILLIRPLGTNFSESLSEIHIFSLKKMHLKLPSVKCRPFCYGLNVFMAYFSDLSIDWYHKSHNASVPYLTIHHSEKSAHFYFQWCIVGYGKHISVLNSALWEIGNVHWGIWGIWSITTILSSSWHTAMITRTEKS